MTGVERKLSTKIRSCEKKGSGIITQILIQSQNHPVLINKPPRMRPLIPLIDLMRLLKETKNGNLMPIIPQSLGK